ncbi:G1/S-specific cyclin-D2-like [Atheta coriaria]|uniref:G1/S-specific cyclin-D2-like n=1 Tax=Dalotia coriaria TaxID=877792 RepID=UPI0031F35A85
MARSPQADSSLYAKLDPTYFSDDRVLLNLLNDEHLYVPSFNYFNTFQTDLQPFMRKVVTTWMLEVCEEQMCEDQVLPLAINYMDRFLCACNIKRQQLQMLGATCLLLASKVRSSSHLPIDLLCAYTDYSVTHEHISSWELLVLSKLKWNLASITAFDYVDQIISRHPWGVHQDLLRRHAHTLIAVFYTETNSIQTPPSLIAAACITSAYRGLKLPVPLIVTVDICASTGVEQSMLENLVQFVDQIVEGAVVQTPEPRATQDKYVTSGEFESPTYGQPETPTEVDNVYF